MIIATYRPVNRRSLVAQWRNALADGDTLRAEELQRLLLDVNTVHERRICTECGHGFNVGCGYPRLCPKCQVLEEG